MSIYTPKKIYIYKYILYIYIHIYKYDCYRWEVCFKFLTFIRKYMNINIYMRI